MFVFLNHCLYKISYLVADTLGGITNKYALPFYRNKSTFLNVSVMGELGKVVRKSTEYGKKI